MEAKRLTHPTFTPISIDVDQNGGAIQQGGTQPVVVPIGDGELVPGADKCPRPPKTGALTRQELIEVAGVGGAGIQGQGELSGTVELVKKGVVEFGIATLKELPMLITSGRGTSNEVRFQLDLPIVDAQVFAGQDVTVSGQITKVTPTDGKITSAVVEGTDGYPFGSWHSVVGAVEHRSLLGIGGEAPPAGSWLRLSKPVVVGGEKFDSLFIDGRDLPQGTIATLTGRFDQRTWGGVARPETPYVALTGVTNQSAGEPSFDGKLFRDAQGKQLETFAWDDPRIADEPATLFVPDQGADKMWIGRMGGFIPREMNPFHGFVGSRAIEIPTPAERRMIGSHPADGTPIVVDTNQKLDRLTNGEIIGGMSTDWYRNPANGDLYRIQNGGFAGFSNFMDQIVRAR